MITDGKRYINDFISTKDEKILTSALVIVLPELVEYINIAREAGVESPITRIMNLLVEDAAYMKAPELGVGEGR